MKWPSWGLKLPPPHYWRGYEHSTRSQLKTVQIYLVPWHFQIVYSYQEVFETEVEQSYSWLMSKWGGFIP